MLEAHCLEAAASLLRDRVQGGSKLPGDHYPNSCSCSEGFPGFVLPYLHTHFHTACVEGGLPALVAHLRCTVRCCGQLVPVKHHHHAKGDTLQEKAGSFVPPVPIPEPYPEPNPCLNTTKEASSSSH